MIMEEEDPVLYVDDSQSKLRSILCTKDIQYVKVIFLPSNNIYGIQLKELFQLPHINLLVLYNNPLSSFVYIRIGNTKDFSTIFLDITGLISIKGKKMSLNLRRLICDIIYLIMTSQINFIYIMYLKLLFLFLGL